MNIKRTVLVGATLVLTALLAACAAAKTDKPATGGAVLLDTEWVLTSLTGKALIKDTQITLGFGEGSLEGSAGCNSYGGSYTATEDSLRLSDLHWTEMGCLEPEGILDQEMAYLNALNTVSSYQVDADRLELYNEAGTQILVFGPQETELPDPTRITPDRTESPVPQESALIATVEAQESLPTGAVVEVKFTLTNTSSEGFFVLKWFTPLEGLAGDIYRVRRDGEDLPYRGKLVKRGPPVSEDYVWLDAGGSISAEVDLAEGYDFSQAGQYTLQFRSPRLSHTAKTLGEQADSVDELEMIRIPSDPVSVTIGRPS
ncbi:META domain-containing protein [Chloroflexota bacterium]